MEQAIARLFEKERKEDLPLADVRNAAALADEAEFLRLLQRMDDENKLMNGADGRVYLI